MAASDTAEETRGALEEYSEAYRADPWTSQIHDRMTTQPTASEVLELEPPHDPTPASPKILAPRDIMRRRLLREFSRSKGQSKGQAELANPWKLVTRKGVKSRGMASEAPEPGPLDFSTPKSSMTLTPNDVSQRRPTGFTGFGERPKRWRESGIPRLSDSMTFSGRERQVAEANEQNSPTEPPKQDLKSPLSSLGSLSKRPSKSSILHTVDLLTAQDPPPYDATEEPHKKASSPPDHRGRQRLRSTLSVTQLGLERSDSSNSVETEATGIILVPTSRVLLDAELPHGVLRKIRLAFSDSERDTASVSLELEWDLFKFVKDQFDHGSNTRLGDVITLSGEVLNAQATTCEDYICHTWPNTGRRTLFSLQAAYNDPNGLALEPYSDDCRFVTIDKQRGTCTVQINNCVKETMMEIAHQLIWIASAFRTSDNEAIQYVHATSKEGVVCFHTESLKELEQSCWLPLFSNPVIVREAAIPRREHGEIGLEAPLEILAALCGARHVVGFEGGMIIKGFSAMLIPVRKHVDSIQWHLIQGEGSERLAYDEAGLQCPSRCLLEEVDSQTIRTCRAFLGWWSTASAHYGFENSVSDIDWSETKEAGRSIRFSGGSLGFEKLAMGQLTFALGAKDGRLQVSYGGRFQTMLACAAKTPVVCYDCKSNRAWLMSALETILHVLCTRASRTHKGRGNHRYQTGPVLDRYLQRTYGQGVRKSQIINTFLQEASAPIAEGQPEKVSKDTLYCLRDAVCDTWSIMERLLEQQNMTNAAPGVDMRGAMQTSLCGWEFMAVVDEREFRKKSRPMKKSNGGWVNLVKDIDAIVLFGTGFSDLIMPIGNYAGPCPRWRSLPVGNDFLATRCDMLESLYETAGSRKSRKYLTSTHLQWNRGHSVFEDCTRQPDFCDCDRLQQILYEPKLSMRLTKPPIELPPDSCIIIGKDSHGFIPKRRSSSSMKMNHRRHNGSVQVNGDSEPSNGPIRTPTMAFRSHLATTGQTSKTSTTHRKVLEADDAEIEVSESDIMGSSKLRPLESWK